MSLLHRVLDRILPQSWADEYVARRWKRPQTFTNLSFVFADDQGRAHYEYPSAYTVPLSRMAVQMQTTAHLSALISEDAIAEARADINKALAHGDVVSAGAIFHRFFDTRTEVVPMDLLINLIALTIVREDEDPTMFDSVTHQSKCDYLKTALTRGDGFFFRLTEVQRLSKAFTITDDHWGPLLTRFAEVKALRQKERDHILSKLSEQK